jgi:sugar lactone lactonase YvrE
MESNVTTSFMSTSVSSSAFVAITRCLRVAVAGLGVFLAACGGSADAPPPPENVPAAVAPTITQQPASLSVTSGQPASFTVAATGTAPLAYQWQRNGVAIAGATATTYSISATTSADTGAVFRAVVTNVAGSATSNNATLTVVTAAPVLTITPQPANTTVVAGATASFTVGGTCSSGTLQIQWQRAAPAGTFADITGATATTYSFTTAAGDTGAQFRANLSCSGQSATTSSVATLTVSVPSAVTLRYLGEITRGAARINPGAVVREPSGTYAFVTGNMIKRLSADQSAITLVTGSNALGAMDGDPTVATFNTPRGLTVDTAGNLYVADTNNYTIRKVTPDGTVSTLAGSVNNPGAVNGTGSVARFYTPTGIAMGPDGNLYVADAGNHKIRRVTPAGVVTDVAGSTSGFTNGAASAAQFSSPFDVAVAANGDVFVSDTGNSVIRRISAGVVTTFAGSGSNATVAPNNGTGTAADIPNPNHLALSGNTLYVYDSAGLIRAIDITTAVVTTFAGTPNNLGPGYVDGLPGHAYLDNSSGNGITPTGDGGLMIGDRRALRITDAAGRVRSIATDVFSGSGSTTDSTTGVLAQLPFELPVNRNNSLFVDPSGGIVVADNSARAIRRIDATGTVAILAGLPGSPAGVVDGVRNEAVFANVGDSITVAPDGTIYTSDDYGVRRIATDGTTTLLAGSSTSFGYVDGPGSAARFNTLRGMAVAPNGDVFVSDAGSQTIRRVNAATGATTTYAGALNRGRLDGTLATAGFPAPGQLNTAPDGSLWVNDGGFLRHIALDGTVTTLGVPTVRSFAIDTDGTIYVGAIGGLYSVPAGVTSGVVTATLLIPAGTELVVSPATPTTGVTIAAVALLGHKQVVMIAQSRLVVATLP